LKIEDIEGVSFCVKVHLIFR